MNAINDIKERAARNKPIKYFDKPRGILVGNNLINADQVAGWEELNSLVYGASNYSSLTYNNNIDVNPNLVKSTSAAIMQAPDETFSTILTEEAQQVQSQVNSYVSKNFVQMFYETYMAPINTKDINNRLGKVLGVVSDMHSLIPAGVPGIMAADNTASWKTTENFSFQFSEGLMRTHPDPYKERTLEGNVWKTNALRAWWGWYGNWDPKDYWRWVNGRWERGHFEGGSEIITEYHSLAFPPYQSHEVVNTENLFEPKASETEDSTVALRQYKADRTYDMENLLYKKGIGTYRSPAFKSINDNIQTLQLFLNRCFGIESTYINEWDESLYIQEGLCNVKEVTENGETVRAPSFVTTLTYGLLEDAPVEGLKDKKDVDLNTITPYASWNMAVSTRTGVDTATIAKHCNEMDYIIKEYPLSTYWYPEQSGEVLDDMNVSRYIDNMFAYRKQGEIWDPSYSREYTSEAAYGSLRYSRKSLLEIINYADDKQAVLSGMNATDKDGNSYNWKMGSALTNDSYKGNAYSYLPFWRQFFTTAEDGLSDIDILMQDVLYNDQPYNSILDIGNRIIEMTTSDNSRFWDYLRARSDTYVTSPPAGSQIAQDDNANILQDANSYGNIEIDIGIASFEIPHTSLLKAWANKDKNTRAAMNKANQTGGMDNAVSVVNSNLKPTKKSSSFVEDANGVPRTVNEYTVEADDDEAAKSALSYGAGVNNYSPFLYGGPHGQYATPLTLEGYCQDENRFLATVPTQDSYTYYHNGINKQYYNRNYSNFTKNYKNRGNFYDKITAITPNERELLITGNVNFGYHPKPQPNNYRWVYYSNNYYNYEMVTRSEATTNSGTESAPQYHWDYAGRRNHWHNGELTPSAPSWVNNLFGSSWGGALWGWVVTVSNSSSKTYSTGYLNDGYSDHHRYDNEYVLRHHGTYSWEEDINLSPDFPFQSFRLLPVGQGLSDRTYIHQDYINSELAFDHNNRIQTDTFLAYTTWEPEDPKKPWRYQRYVKVNHYKPVEDIVEWNAHCWYLVAPVGSPSNTWVDGRRYVTYSSQGSAWYNALERMYRPNAGNELLCTLPIYDGNNITNVICAVGRIIKDFTYVYRYVWRLHIGWRWSWRWSWHWFHFHWWGGFYFYWKLHRVVRTETTYNLFIDPNRTRYNIPTRYLIDREARVNPNRSFESSNPVERWATDQSTGGTFGHLGTDGSPMLNPWDPSFKNRYGWWNNGLAMIGAYDTDEAQMYYRGGHGQGAFLRCEGIFFADMIDNYNKHNQQCWYCTVTTPIVKSRMEYFHTIARTKQDVGLDRWGYGTTSYANYWTRWGYRYGYSNDNYWKYSDFYTYDGSNYHELLCWADRANWIPTSWSIHWTLTNIFRDMPRTKSVLEYSATGANPILAWYHATDPFDVYIDTAQQQIQWMKQLDGYVVNNVTDKNIWEVYSKVTDKKIKNVITMKNAVGRWDDVNDKNHDPYFTGSFTEDVNYFDGLDIVYNVFRPNRYDPNKNTLHELLSERIYYLERFRDRALYLRNQLLVDSVPQNIVRQFSILVSNTRLYLNCAECRGNTVESTSGWGDGWRLSNYLMYSDSTTTYNILRNPGAVLWAYLNVLYQARKYWVNLRLDKSFGSYWLLRGLERVLVFTMAQDTAVVPSLKDASAATDVEDPTKRVTRKIHFVEARSTLEERMNDTSISPVYTNAVYVKVDYLNISNPTASESYRDGKFEGKEIRYVPEVYKWAYKPTDQLYYVMSSYITSHLKEYIQERKQILDSIYSGSYRLSEKDYDKLRTSLSYLQEGYVGQTIASIGMLTEMEYRIEELQNALLQDKASHYNQLIEDLLYPVYIKFEPEHVWTGNYENDSKGKNYIDEYQAIETSNKERTRKDSYGVKHTHQGAISAGITFDVMSTLNVVNLLNNIQGLQTATADEILCGCKNTIDLWRVQLPPEMKVPTEYLQDKPILVPAYLIDLSVSGVLAKDRVPQPRDVLVGLSSTEMSPILEPAAGLLTVNTQAALGIVDKVDFGINVDVKELNS